MKQRHYILIIQRNIRCHELMIRLIILIIHSRRTNVFFQRLNHGRIIMPQNIQLQQVMINGMVIKVSCNNVRLRIISRMLHRCKRINFFSQRKYDNSSRMLTGTSSNSSTSLYNPVNFTVSFSLSALLIIVLYISKCRLIRQCSNGSGTVSLTGSKNNLRIFMCITLIISREIQVDIRLLISFKSQECLKRNVKSVFHQRFPTDRTCLIRHIPSAAACISSYLIRFKITVMTFFTIIMRAQRIYLCNSRHSSDKGRSDRTSGTNQIPILIGLPHQLLGNDIHYGKPIGNNRIQLSLQPLCYHLRQILSIHGMRLIITDLS